MTMGPTNNDVTMRDVIEIEAMAKLKLPAAEIASRKRLPYWRIIDICKNQHVAVRP